MAMMVVVMVGAAWFAFNHDLSWRVRVFVMLDGGMRAAVLRMSAMVGGVGMLGFTTYGAAHDVPLTNRARDFGWRLIDNNLAAFNYFSSVGGRRRRGFDHVCSPLCRGISVRFILPRLEDGSHNTTISFIVFFALEQHFIYKLLVESLEYDNEVALIKISLLVKVISHANSFLLQAHNPPQTGSRCQ